MADTKKIFTIQINGIKESSDAIEVLNKQLDELENKIKDLEKKRVKVSASSSTGSSSGGSDKGSKTQLTEEQKLQQQINKEIEKRAAMQTKEYQELLKQKNATKDIATEQKQISTGALSFDDSGAKEYTNTLAGMKAQLAVLKAESQNFDLTGWTGEIDDLPDSVKAANEAIKALSDQIKNFENSQGTFSRGVGDYYNQFKKALEDSNKEITKTGNTLQGLQSKQTALKGLVNTTKLGTDEWKKYKNELDAVNKEISSISGNPIRAEDLIDTKVTVEINGLTLEFDDLQQSISVLEDKLYQMKAAGEEGTEAFRNIQEQLVRTKQTIQDTDATIDAMTSRTRGLDLTVQSFQALTAAMQVGAGVAGLFGNNQEDLQKTIARVTSLMSIAQGVQELYNQVTQKGTALNKLWQLSIKGADKVISLFSKTQRVATATTTTNTTAVGSNAVATGALATTTGAATAATGALSIAMRVLKVAIASTGIGLLVVALGSLVGWLMSASYESEEFAKSLKTMESQIDSVNNKLNNTFKNIDLSVSLGNNSELNGLLEKLKEIERQYQSIGGIIQNIGIQQVANSGTNKYYEEAVKYGRQLKVISVEYDNLLREQNYGIENIEEWNDKLEDVKKSYTKLLTIQLANAADLTDKKMAMREILAIFEQINNTAIGQSVINNLENILPNKSDAEALKTYLDQIKTFGSDYQDLENDIRIKINEINKKADEDNLASLKDGLNKRLIEIRKGRETELKELNAVRGQLENIPGLSGASDTLKKAEAAINAKYNKQEADVRKEFAKEMANIERSIQTNKISIMREGLDKTISQLNLSRQSEIDAAKETGIKVGEQTKAINAKYDNEILKAKEDFYRKREDSFKAFAANYRQIADSFATADYEKQVNQTNTNSEEEQASLTFDTDATLNDSLNKQREYYNEIVKLKMEANERLNQLDKNRATDTMFGDMQDENSRYQDRLRVLEDYHKQGLTTEEEYNSQIENETEQHNFKLQQIEEDGQRAIIDIDKKTADNRKQIIAQANESTLRNFNEYYDEIGKLNNKSQQSFKLTGIIDYGSTKKNLEKVKNEYNILLKQIENEYVNLQKQFDNNEITFNDFQQAKKELKSLTDDTKEAVKNTSQSLTELISETINSYTQLIGGGLQMVGEIWQAISDMRVAAIEAQISDLEDEYDALEDAYSKQEELVQRHTDKVNDIESELRTARGDRRAYLIEQLNSERRAQIEALQEEENIQRKKDQNEKKQEALDKKRQREQKKAAKAQAIISGALTIANAFATAPFIPVGIAMGALATGLVAVQIAKINATQYADGGLLNGKSHAQGGIPVGMTGIEVEGNEYVVNKKSTQANLPLIEYINSNRRTLTRDDLVSFFDNGKQSLVNKGVRKRYATGGQLPEMDNIDIKNLINYEPETDERPIQVQVVDIINATENVRQVQTLSGI